MTDRQTWLIITILIGIFIELTLIRWDVREAKGTYMDSTTTICFPDLSSSTGVTCEVGTLSRERRIVPKNSNSNVTM